jgi:anti-anti-sigma factor
MSEFTIERDQNSCRVEAGKELTAALIPSLQAALKKEIDSGALIITFDLRNTAMLDSSGIGLLIAASNSLARKQGELRVANVSEDIYHLLQSMRLVSRLKVARSQTP